MAECSDVLPLLSAFQDAELEPHRMLAVARHLAGCAGCEGVLNDFDTVGRELRDAAPVIPLEGFAEAVQNRIARLEPGPLGRIKRWLSSLEERMTAGLALASAAIAVAAVTALIITPYANRLMNSGAANTTTMVASASPALPPVNEAVVTAAAESAGKVAAADSHAIISRLEAKNPAVAVWSEPRTDTTVIWLPDQQH